MSKHLPTCDCGCLGIGPAVTEILGRISPAEARQHFLAARVEFLKGIRALIDARIAHLSGTPDEGVSVPVE